mgnify:CR=1 FL=1
MLSKEQEIQLLMMLLDDDEHSLICQRILALNEECKLLAKITNSVCQSNYEKDDQ